MKENKYDALTNALKISAQHAEKNALKEDGGACNFDSAVLWVRNNGMTVKKILESVKNAGLSGYETKWIGSTCVFVNGFERGQANCRTAMVEAFEEKMRELGYYVNVYYQMD